MSLFEQILKVLHGAVDRINGCVVGDLLVMVNDVIRREDRTQNDGIYIQVPDVVQAICDPYKENKVLSGR